MCRAGRRVAVDVLANCAISRSSAGVCVLSPGNFYLTFAEVKEAPLSRAEKLYLRNQRRVEEFVVPVRRYIAG